MKKFYKHILYLPILGVVPFLGGCAEEISGGSSTVQRGLGAEAYISLGDRPETRVTYDTYDHWSIATFSSGDVVGFYTLKGRQNPADESVFDQDVVNQPMYYEGRIGNYYRFSNPDIKVDALTVGSSFSKMYYPYFADMPSTTASSGKGIQLRKMDVDGIEKCIDFMYSSNTGITLTNGMLQPTFNHYCGVIGIQRGEGFDSPDDPTIWVVMQNPYTDIRITQTSSTSSFDYTLQNTTDESEEELLISLNPDKPNQTVNKNRAWQCWPGFAYNGLETYYVLVPPGNVSYILMQNNKGQWVAVSDFYLNSTSNKSVSSNYRYMLSVKMESLETIVKPVFVAQWNEEVRITDDRKVGMQSPDEFTSWIKLYNSYVEQGRPEELVEDLRQFGDAESIGSDGQYKWKFYINDNIDLEPKGNYTITKLEDLLEGSSVYTNYIITNLRHTLIEEMGEGGGLHALDFNELYVIDTEGGQEYCGGIIRRMTGGTVDACNVKNGIVVSNKITGMVAGLKSGGIITNCMLSGDVIGISSDTNFPGVVGELSGSAQITGNNTTELNFMNYQ